MILQVGPCCNSVRWKVTWIRTEDVDSRQRCGRGTYQRVFEWIVLLGVPAIGMAPVPSSAYHFEHAWDARPTRGRQFRKLRIFSVLPLVFHSFGPRCLPKSTAKRSLNTVQQLHLGTQTLEGNCSILSELCSLVGCVSESA